MGGARLSCVVPQTTCTKVARYVVAYREDGSDLMNACAAHLPAAVTLLDLGRMPGEDVRVRCLPATR